MIDALTTLLSSPMMQRSLLAALIVGLTAPIIGTYLVHRRLAAGWPRIATRVRDLHYFPVFIPTGRSRLVPS